MINIYNNNNELILSVKEYEYNGSFMGDRVLVANVKSPTPIEFNIGDYTYLGADKFILYEIPDEKKISSLESYGGAFEYSLRFLHESEDLNLCSFMDYVTFDNNTHYSNLNTFSFYGDVSELAERIRVNLNRLFPSKWTINIHSSAPTKILNVSANNISCLQALGMVNTVFGTTFTIKGRVITIGAQGRSIPEIFQYKDGLIEVSQTSQKNQMIITRLRAYGSKKNLPDGYNRKGVYPQSFVAPGLMLPNSSIEGIDYIDSVNKGEYGVREGAVYFDGKANGEEIFPSIEGMTASQLISAGVPTTATGALDMVVSATQVLDYEQPTIDITIKDIGFDINDYIGDNPVISMKSGDCIGSDLAITEVIKEGDNYKLTVNRTREGDFYIPNLSQHVKAGDKFVLLGIRMPDVYVLAAERRLLAAAKEYLAANDHPNITFSPKVDSKYIHENDISLSEGDLLSFIDEDLGIGGAILIDTLKINFGGQIPIYEIALSESKQIGTLQRMQNQINFLVSSLLSGSFNLEQTESLIRLIGGREFLSKVRPDTARALIKFLDGSEFGEFASGMFTGKGGRIDSSGNGELESLIIRSLLEVPELRYNRLTLVGEDLAIGAGGVITEVWQDEDEDGIVINPNSYNIRLKLEEGDIIPFHLYDIVKGIYHQKTGFYTSWFRVDAIYHNLQYMTISLGANEAVPSGRNYPPRPFMNIAKWGNFVDTTRQSTIFLSAKDGHIIMLDGVDNYKGGYKSFQLGKPEGLENVIDFNKLTQINKEQGYLYARGIMVSDIIEIDYLGAPIRKIRDRGIWSFETAISEEPYEYTETLQDEVWVGWSRYRCIVDKPKGEPSRQSSEWVLVYSIEDAIKEETKSLTQGLEDVSSQLGSAQTNIGELDSAMYELKTQTLVALADGLISEAERRSLYSIYVRLDVEQEQLLSDVTYALNSIYMPDLYKAKLQSISNKFLASGGSLDQYQASIDAILDHADPHVTEYERAEYERTLKIYSRDYKSLLEALRDSRLAIDAEIKRLANQKTDEVEGGKNLIRNYDQRWDFDFWGGEGISVDIDLDAITIVNQRGLIDDGNLIEDESGNIIELV